MIDNCYHGVFIGYKMNVRKVEKDAAYDLLSHGIDRCITDNLEFPLNIFLFLHVT